MFRGITLDLHGDLVVEPSACMRVVKSEVQHRNVIVKGQTNSYSQTTERVHGGTIITVSSSGIGGKRNVRVIRMESISRERWHRYKKLHIHPFDCSSTPQTPPRSKAKLTPSTSGPGRFDQYGLLTMLERLRPPAGAREALVGRFRFFLLIASTSFCSATI